MKKYFKTFICSMMCLFIMISGISASAVGSMQMEWRGDYSDNANPKLVVTFTSPAPYIQQVSAVIYPAAVANPTYADYVRMKEITVDGNTKTELTFDITDNFEESDYKYLLALQSSGHMQATSNEIGTVYAINKSAVDSLLSEFRVATEATMGGVIDKVALPLQLSGVNDTTRKSDRITSLFNIKTTDFNGSFTTLEDVRDAWEITDVIVYVGETDATAAGVKEKLIPNADIFGINTEDDDFVAYAEEACADMLLYGGSYNNNAGILSLTDFRAAFNEYLGVIAVNNATETNLKDVFEKYKSYFGISTGTLTDYSNLISTDKGKVLRQLYQKNFERASELANAFTIAVSDVKLETGTTGTLTTVTPPSDDDSGSGSAATTGNVTALTVPVTPQNKGFADVTSAHWAYQYVTGLAEKGIIGGYDDNTYKPEKNVTREEFVKMVVNATGLYDVSASCEFTDVKPGDWHYLYVASAFKNDVVSGIDETLFGTGRNITRQDVAVIAARLLKTFRDTLPETGDAVLTDFDTVSDYAQDSVNLLSAMGIINGFDDGTFRPHNALTRAEAATIISKLIDEL